MIDTKSLLMSFLNAVRTDAINDLKSKKISDGDLNMKMAADAKEGDLSGDAHWYYLVHGRKPGKQPPPDSIIGWIQRKGIQLNGITEKAAAFLIGRKIARVGTDIYTGKRPGLALPQIIDKNNEVFRGQLMEAYLAEFKEAFSKDLHTIFS